MSLDDDHAIATLVEHHGDPLADLDEYVDAQQDEQDDHRHHHEDQDHHDPNPIEPAAHHDDDDDDDEGLHDLSPSRKGKRKRGDPGVLRKAPQAPKRFKSSYICFFMAKQPVIKEELGEDGTVTAISKRSAEMWRTLPPEERAHWDDVAAKDKQRYLMEKANYTGPWQVPWKRTRKDPSAPKRPMSAFLYYSQGKRTELKKQNPDMKNTEVSRLLGEMWRNAPEAERQPHVENEREERKKYKVAIAEWRHEQDVKQEAHRKAQAEAFANMPPPPQQPPMHTHMALDYGMMAPLPSIADPYPPGIIMPNNSYGYAPNHPAANHGTTTSTVPYNTYGYAPMPPPLPPPAYYTYPTNGKQPVILGPSGTPVYGAAPTGPVMSQYLPAPAAFAMEHQSALPAFDLDNNVDLSEDQQQVQLPPSFEGEA